MLPSLIYVIALLAITFDVGYFSAIDLNLFTLFSLPEHLLFAFEAIPIAVVLIVFLGANYLIVSRGVPRFLERDEIAQKKKRRRFGPTGRLRSRVYLACGLIVALGIYVYLTRNTIGILVGVVSLVPSTVACFELVVAKKQTKYGRPLLLLLAIFVSYIDGFLLAMSYVDVNVYPAFFQQIKLKENQTQSIRIIRSGDNGLLYVDMNSGTIQFRKWDVIEEISTKSGFGTSR